MARNASKMVEIFWGALQIINNNHFFKKLFLTFRFGYFIELDLELFSSYLAKKTGFVNYQKEIVENQKKN